MSVLFGTTSIGRILLGDTEIGTALLGSVPVFDTAGAPASAPVNIAAPTLSGDPAVGGILAATPGTWSGNPRPSYSPLWCRDGTPIASASGFTYTPVSADIGAVITCDVTADNSQGSATATSQGMVIAATPATSGLTWPSTVLTAHVGRSGSVSATEWRDDSGHGNHMALVGAPTAVEDGSARAVQFDGSSQYGVFAADVFQKENGRFGPVNIAVTAKFPVDNLNKALIGDAGTNGHIVISDSNSSAAITNNVSSLRSLGIGVPTEAGGLSGETAIVPGVDDGITVSALQNPDSYQTIIIRQVVLGSKWTIPHLFERNGSRRWNASAVSVTVWTGTAAQDEIDIITNHWKAVSGRYDVSVPPPPPPPPPSIVGVAEAVPTEYKTSLTIPFHAGTSAGNTVLAVAYVHGGETTLVAPDGWISLGRVAANPNHTWMEVFAGTASSGQSNVALTSGGLRELSGVAVTLDSGAPGASAAQVYTYATSSAAPTVTVEPDGTSIAFLVFAGSNSSMISIPTIGFVHKPNTKWSSKTGGITWSEGESMSTSTAVTFSHNYGHTGILTVAINPNLGNPVVTADITAEFNVGSP